MIRRGDIVKHRSGLRGEVVADQANKTVLVAAQGVLHTWQLDEIVSTQSSAVDTELFYEDDEETPSPDG